VAEDVKLGLVTQGGAAIYWAVPAAEELAK